MSYSCIHRAQTRLFIICVVAYYLYSIWNQYTNYLAQHIFRIISSHINSTQHNDRDCWPFFVIIFGQSNPISFHIFIILCTQAYKHTRTHKPIFILLFVVFLFSCIIIFLLGTEHKQIQLYIAIIGRGAHNTQHSYILHIYILYIESIYIAWRHDNNNNKYVYGRIKSKSTFFSSLL